MGVAQQRRLIVVNSSPWRWRGEAVADGFADCMPYKDQQQYASAAGHVRAIIYVAVHRWWPACTLRRVFTWAQAWLRLLRERRTTCSLRGTNESFREVGDGVYRWGRAYQGTRLPQSRPRTKPAAAGGGVTCGKRDSEKLNSTHTITTCNIATLLRHFKK